MAKDPHIFPSLIVINDFYYNYFSISEACPVKLNKSHRLYQKGYTGGSKMRNVFCDSSWCVSTFHYINVIMLNIKTQNGELS